MVDYSIKNISLLLEQEDEMLLYGQFLDCFYISKTNEERIMLIAEEPIYNIKHKVFLCILAATVEKLSIDYGLPIPKWVNNDKYTMKEIYYAFNTKNIEFQKYLEDTTPYEYKKRNLIVGESMLERC